MARFLWLNANCAHFITLFNHQTCIINLMRYVAAQSLLNFYLNYSFSFDFIRIHSPIIICICLVNWFFFVGFCVRAWAYCCCISIALNRLTLHCRFLQFHCIFDYTMISNSRKWHVRYANFFIVTSFLPSLSSWVRFFCWTVLLKFTRFYRSITCIRVSFNVIPYNEFNGILSTGDNAEWISYLFKWHSFAVLKYRMQIICQWMRKRQNTKICLSHFPVLFVCFYFSRLPLSNETKRSGTRSFVQTEPIEWSSLECLKNSIQYHTIHILPCTLIKS